MSFMRDRLPETISYFESEGLRLIGPRNAKWLTTECRFHGGSDSLRTNLSSGAWVCMACGEKGGDVLAYHMKMYGLEFVQAAQALGAWVEDGKPHRPFRPTALSPRAALDVLGVESTVVAILACDLSKGKALLDTDRERLLLSASRIRKITGEFAS